MVHLGVVPPHIEKDAMERIGDPSVGVVRGFDGWWRDAKRFLSTGNGEDLKKGAGSISSIGGSRRRGVKGSCTFFIFGTPR